MRWNGHIVKGHKENCSETWNEVIKIQEVEMFKTGEGSKNRMV